MTVADASAGGDGRLVRPHAYPGVGTWIERRARVAADHVAVVFGDRHRTYGELAVRVRRLAHALRTLGVKRGDRVAWIGANHPAFLETLFASATIGAALTPINHRLDRPTLDAVSRAAAPRVALIHGMASELALPPSVNASVAVSPSEEPDSPYEQLVAAGSADRIDQTISPDDLCLLPFTSGTTGTPKGIVLTHGNVTWNVINCLSCIDFRSDDVTIAAAPFFRTGGTGVNVLPVLFTGGTVVIPRRTDPDEMFRLLERHRVTVGFGNPDLLDGLTTSPSSRAGSLASVRAFVTGGAPVPERLLHRCHDRGIRVLQGYGLSEAGPVVSVLDAANALRKIGSAGRPALFVDTRLVAPDGRAPAPGEIGELLVRGPNVMAGYWQSPDLTNRAIDRDGWLRTGDAVRLDAEGFLFIVGRIEDAYVSGGVVVHPGIIERALLEHPAVEEVCVLGGAAGGIACVVASGRAGETLESELRSFCSERLPPGYGRVAIEFLSSLPRNPGGKIMRHVLRQRLVDGNSTRP